MYVHNQDWDSAQRVAEAPSHRSQLEKGPTGVAFSKNPAVLAHADCEISGPKVQEGAPPPGGGGLPRRAEGAAEPGCHVVGGSPILVHTGQ